MHIKMMYNTTTFMFRNVYHIKNSKVQQHELNLLLHQPNRYNLYYFINICTESPVLPSLSKVTQVTRSKGADLELPDMIFHSQSNKATCNSEQQEVSKTVHTQWLLTEGL